MQEAINLIDVMLMQPNESVWGAFLTGCRKHGNTELATSVADGVFESDPVRKPRPAYDMHPLGDIRRQQKPEKC